MENPQQNKFIKNNTMHTNLIKYGVKVPAHNKIIFEKIKNNKFNEGKWNSWYGLTSKEYSKNSIYSKDHLNYLRKHFTIQEIETFVKNKTNIEYKIINMLNRRNISYVYNELYNKKYKPDFIINNLIIECDGLYWHSNKFKDKYYHKNKKQYYDNNQIISLFFRENEILNKFNIVEHLICKELNLNDDIDINNYYCVETNDNSFLYENSINYNSDHLICQVIYNESVVCATNFKLIGNNLYLSNYCTKQFINIKKGLDKIIKYLLTKYDIEYIEYSANLRYEKSKIESNYNFIDCGTTYSFEWTDCKNTFNLNDKPTTKCYKIWDCGQKKFKLNL